MEMKIMLSQTKSKKGVSIVIGYVILVSFVIVLGIVVYSWMKTYVPTEDFACPDGVSMFIKNYECSTGELTLYLRNNGKFNIGGYFIYAANSPGQELATIDISKNISSATGTWLSPTGVRFGGIGDFGSTNSFAPNKDAVHEYSTVGVGTVYLIEILPIRWQEENNKLRLVSCTNAKIRESVLCGEGCIPDCTGRNCGDNGCGDTCGSCPTGEDCNSTGQCVLTEECTETCTSLGLECGYVCGESCGLCPTNVLHTTYRCVYGLCIIESCEEGWANCDGNIANGCEAELGTDLNCASCGDVCTSGHCIDGSCTTCNSAWLYPESPGVECDGGVNCNFNCTCVGEYVPDGIGGCQVPASISTCPSYCIFIGYSNGGCRQNNAQCRVNGQITEHDGDIYCTVSVTPVCCCTP